VDIRGDVFLPAAPDQVKAALHDPTVLQRVLPGCEALEEESPGVYRARLSMGIAAVRGRYEGRLVLGEDQLTVSGQGSAGFVEAKIPYRLEAEGEGTRLHYDGEAKVGGLLAGVGQRVLGGVSRVILDQFWANFAKALEQGGAPPA
jgi:carbon monoxide dehydrogenase subunit G